MPVCEQTSCVLNRRDWSRYKSSYFKFQQVKTFSITRLKLRIDQQLIKYSQACAPTPHFNKKLPLTASHQSTQSPEQWKVHSASHELREGGCKLWGWQQESVDKLHPLCSIQWRKAERMPLNHCLLKTVLGFLPSWLKGAQHVSVAVSGRACWVPGCLD